MSNTLVLWLGVLLNKHMHIRRTHEHLCNRYSEEKKQFRHSSKMNLLFSVQIGDKYILLLQLRKIYRYGNKSLINACLVIFMGTIQDGRLIFFIKITNDRDLLGLNTYFE